jgi:hypothetical protein
LRLGAAQLRQTVGAFALNQRQQRFAQKLRALSQTADFLGDRKSVV